MKLGIRCLGIVSHLGSLRPVSAAAQTAAELRPTAYAIKDAKVVVEPGTVLDKATVIIRDGLHRRSRNGCAASRRTPRSWTARG